MQYCNSYLAFIYSWRRVHADCFFDWCFADLLQSCVTFERFEVLNGHSKNSELVQFPGHGVTGRDHCRQLVNQVVHFVPPSFLNLTMRFSAN